MELGNIILVPKFKLANCVENFCPISLLSIVGKMLEKFISFIMMDFIEDNHLLSDSQWGFRAGRSTCSALLNITHTRFNILDKGEELVVVFFDYHKAFDSIPHNPLLQCRLLV